MSNVKILYDQYWTKEKEEFTSYARNLLLPHFFKKGEKVLDVGCGDGVVAEFLHKNVGVEVVGIDISEEAVTKALERGINAKVYNSESKFPFKDNFFDVVFWGDNVEHLFNPSLTAKEIKRVLKDGGRLVLSCPNMGYWRYRIYYFLNGSLPDTEWTSLPPWSWSHIRFFNIKILTDFLTASGFRKITKIVGVSERRLDRPFLSVFPTIFGMILIVEVK